jgi:hypothetical protein
MTSVLNGAERVGQVWPVLSPDQWLTRAGVLVSDTPAGSRTLPAWWWGVRSTKGDTVQVTFATTTFAPVVLGFFGLGTGYLIYGAQELFDFPPRDPAVDRATGVWGIWLPGFTQFVTGVYLFVALVWFESLKTPALFTAALAFSAYGIHWFALGWNRYQGNDTRPNAMMSVAFIILSVLGMVVFFAADSWPVGVVFVGLTGVYVSELAAGITTGVRRRHADQGAPAPAVARVSPAERLLGLFHIATGLWLMYITFATTLNISSNFHLPGA